MVKRFNNIFREFFTFSNLDPIIENHVRDRNEIIIGGQAINKQTGLFSRPSSDFDILSSNPITSAKKLERRLDNQAGRDLFFTRSSFFHPVTKKVIYEGPDGRKNTRDDVGIADISPLKKIRTVKINGVRYAALPEIVKDKRRALRDKQFSFRHEKDREDINRIGFYRKARKF